MSFVVFEFSTEKFQIFSKILPKIGRKIAIYDRGGWEPKKT